MKSSTARARIIAGLAAGLAAACSPAAPAPAAPAAAAAPLDDFETAGAWKAQASDGVLASAGVVPGVRGQAIELRFDFRGHGGHAGIERPLPLQLPSSNYEVSFFVRGDAPPNDLQVKLVDGSGDNVWWYRQRALELSPDWRRISFKKRQVEFAWGPTRDRALREAASIELVLAAGAGGRGAVAFDELSIRELPEPPAVPPAPVASATAGAAEAPLAVDGRLETAWRVPAAAPRQLELDLGYEREFGGLVLRWAPEAHAAAYDVELSSDRVSWQLVRRVTRGNGRRDALLLPESEARHVRLTLREGPGESFALAEVEVKDLAFGATPNAFLAAEAKELPRGRYPRAHVGEQPYWTVVGVDAGSDSGLLSEDGALEVSQGGFSIEPFVVSGSELVTWADVEIEQALEGGYLPIPSVTWRRPEWQLKVTALAAGDREQAELAARYDLENRTAGPLELKLLLAVRPLQVNPPTQSLNQLGGYSPISELAWEGSTLSVNGSPRVRLLEPPARVILEAFDAADFPERLPPGTESDTSVQDPAAMASGLLEFPLTIPAGQAVTLGLAAPLLGEPAAPGRITSLASLARAEQEVAAGWREKLDRVQIRVPAAGQALVDTLRSSLAHILLSRVGPMLRPGTRSYARSWIRDGAMMSESLLRLGHEAVAAEYFDWYAPFQFEGGKVPCCVDARGADPVPENDSPGELIFLAAELYRFTRDRAWLERSWPRVEAAAGYLESLRQEERSPENQAPERRELYGLLPASISHEGYSDKPAYSYWDDFWGLIGFQDAAWLAEVRGDAEAHARLARQRDEFREDLYASLRASAARHGVSYLPGAADRGDFDATSTTIAIAPGRERSRLPRDLLLGTFERYWQEFSARRSGSKDWEVYTPYELRVAGTFVRLGWRERAHVLFDFFMADRRPAAWNQWAEVVGRDAREPRFIGDMPHAWVSSDYIRSVLDLFAYAEPEAERLVLAAGVPPSWVEERGGVSVRGLRTPYGALGYELARAGQEVVLSLREGAAPPGGFVLPWLWAGPANARVTIDGVPARWEAGQIVVRGAPARIVIERPPAN